MLLQHSNNGKGSFPRLYSISSLAGIQKVLIINLGVD